MEGIKCVWYQLLIFEKPRARNVKPRASLLVYAQKSFMKSCGGSENFYNFLSLLLGRVSILICLLFLSDMRADELSFCERWRNIFASADILWHMPTCTKKFLVYRYIVKVRVRRCIMTVDVTFTWKRIQFDWIDSCQQPTIAQWVNKSLQRRAKLRVIDSADPRLNSTSSRQQWTTRFNVQTISSTAL